MNASATYDVIVVGGGHAGAEAAWAAANLLRPSFDEATGSASHTACTSHTEGAGRVALITMDPAKIGTMSCNPAIGGLAKGQMVCEIDALGGLMGHAIDATGIQFRILNQSKGPAVRGPRAQADKYQYARAVQRILATRPNLDIIAGQVESFEIERGAIAGVHIRRADQSTATCATRAVVLTTGTFMRGLMHTGETKTQGGRVGEQAAVGISGALTQLGLELGRLKTGTPPRLAAESIDYACLERQPGDDTPTPFSVLTADGSPFVERFPLLPQRDCWLTQTNERAHQLIRDNLHRAPMYNGQIETAGPRYCPSIEDKVVRFADRSAHHVFLEPESLSTNEIYCNGISTSLPADVQDVIVRNLPGCERARILRYGYAVEYDMVWPHQIDSTCMAKSVEGLFLAGQINGTSGYEEAAGQGLVAGLNAVRLTRGQSLAHLGRDQAYIGVLLDDLVTKTPREPYRMFSSRAEHRLLLRADNAPERLTPIGRELGLVDDARWAHFQRRQHDTDLLRNAMRTTAHEDRRVEAWARQPRTDVAVVTEMLKDVDLPAGSLEPRLVGRVLADIQYAGYIERQRREIDRLASQESTSLPGDFDFTAVHGLRREAAAVLDRFRPATLGQAGRLAGVNPADLMVISVALQRA